MKIRKLALAVNLLVNSEIAHGLKRNTVLNQTDLSKTPIQELK
jgi:hypothetical protein